ncbi:hypothetical protein SAMN04487911_104133 [Arenibacter nanhaiticus]|uniref:Alpha-2-macroglobulin family N-terminal region n=1 Tax=Arenibacter nanhaiticus TaxID=558155 RepID=A0A1M6D252_9FLAO|nr:MG2 domain-containing protein [Arenibacter nanhaiticus]SHI67193.1 hypothetical protein SAMN04487911_104133 [Arenibacter nanhaiticus]
MKFIFYSVLFLLLIGCKQKKETVLDSIDNINRYKEYINEVSHGIISSEDQIRVVLTTPVLDWKQGKELNDGVLQASPKLKGKVVALNSTTLAFVPQNGFDHDTSYKFRLNLGKIIPEIPKELHVLTFKVKTIKQQFNVYAQAPQSYSKEYQFVEGHIKSADQLSLEKAKKLVEASQNGNDIPIKFETAIGKGTQFYFKIDSIRRFEKDSEIEVRWSGAPIGVDSKGANTIIIPGKNNFSILNVEVSNGAHQMLRINFSDPLKKGQNFKGLVVLEGAKELTYDVVGNTLKVFPSKAVIGTPQLEIFEGIQSVDGYKLKTKYQERLAFEQMKPEVRLLSNGTILPSANNLKINFEAVNLRFVDVQVFRIFENNILQFLQDNNLNEDYNLKQVGRPIAYKKLDLQNSASSNADKWVAHALDLKSLIRPEPGALYKVAFSIKPSYSLYQCEFSNFNNSDAAIDDFDQAAEDSRWDEIESYYEDYYENYDWNERDNPCHTSYYYNKTASTNILATNLGVIIKRGTNKNYFISVNDLVSTAPITGAKVTFYNYQQQAVGQVMTGMDGTSIYEAEHLAYFAIAESRGQKTYIKLNDGNALSVSKFKVSGLEPQKGIKGYIFGERGVWRPGDTLYLTFMLNDNANKLPENHPVKLELIDPYQKLVAREVHTNPIDNMYAFTLKTETDAPTGNWTAKVAVGGATFVKKIRIETIKPNRLKINTTFSQELLSLSKPIKGELQVAWMHGAKAKNLKADITAKFKPQATHFKNYEGYVFDDPTRAFKSEDLLVFNNKINAEGKAAFSVSPQFTSEAPGMLNAVFLAKVYENGGDFSTDVFSKPLSPYSTYVGLNAPKGDEKRGMLLTDVPQKFEVVTVDEQGNPKATENLKASVYKVQWRWWWETNNENLSSFNSDNYREKVFEKNLSTDAKGKAEFTFTLKYPEWGRYLVRIEDEKGKHATGQTIYVDWPGWAGKSRKNDPSAATMLVFSTDKESYKVGEKAIVTLPSSQGGRALVTLENGTEVLHSLWVDTQNGETKFEIPITEAHTPNVYLSISLLQPHATTLNDSPIRMYGVVPIAVENPKTMLEPTISMPALLRPEESFALKVNEKQGKAMTYTIAVVDEGILDLSRFKTPDPWNTFYAHEALGVKTWDVYDDVIGAFGGRIDQVFAIGGDGELIGAKNRKANRFKPMVLHLGPFTLKEGETKSHQITIPKYIGAVRTMVVAGNSEKAAYGAAEKSTPVRKPLMVLASLPRKITPGESVTLPVTVFALENKIKQVRLKIKEDPSFIVQGGAEQKVTFSQPEEKMAYFQLSVADFNGIGKVEVEASGNGEYASFEIPIDVVNPNPVTTSLQEIVLEANETKTIDLKTFGIPGSNSAAIELSTLPPMNFNGRMQYLIQYPHGCLEQITAAAFPQLYLSDVFEVPASRKKQLQENVTAAIKRLGASQIANGGFSYWPGQQNADDWSTSFAGHFLLEAAQKGYVLPLGFKSAWMQYQQNRAKQWRAETNASDLAQAYRLYTLALAGNSDIASMNRLRETATLSNEAKYRLAAAYALIGQDNIAKDLVQSANYDFDRNPINGATFGSPERNRAMALETFVLLKDKVRAQELAKVLAKELSKDQWMNTQTTSYCLLAMAKFARMLGGKGIAASFTLQGKTNIVETQKTLANSFLNIKNGNNKLVLKNTGNNALYVGVLNSGVLPVGEEQEQQQNLVAKVVYKGRNGSKLDPTSLGQGTDFVAEVTLTNTSENTLKNVALTQIFPSGWEIVNTRFTDFGDFEENDVTHTDLRDDRANFYFDMKKKETKTFRVLLNASFLGKYYLPGIQAQAMYDNDYKARTKGMWVNVIR